MKVAEHHNEIGKIRNNIIGHHTKIQTPFGEKPLIYADWIAGGRLYRPIEERILNEIGPMVANTHSESSQTGQFITLAYEESRRLIKQHVGAGNDDVLIFHGSGMTGVVNKLQRILGLRLPENISLDWNADRRPVIFITHMEHHSNHTSWLECEADVVVIPPDEKLLVNPDSLEELLDKYASRPLKIGAFTAGSNVTGIQPDYYQLAEIMHRHDGLCFVDFAAAAPYVEINMHPADPMQKLDAIYFSPHKFLGGPGSAGVLVFDKSLYTNKIPDITGGGTVTWTNPWGEHAYIEDIEAREDGGTPGFLQGIKAALAIKLKEEFGVPYIKSRENELLRRSFEVLRQLDNVHTLAPDETERLGVISFYIDGLHYNLGVRLLNDLFGIQVRGGCSCAGTYGHYLLHVDQETSKKITSRIDQGILDDKPGWIRLSLHYTMTDEELEYTLDAISHIASEFSHYEPLYGYNLHKIEFFHENHREEHISPLFRGFF